MTIMLYGDDDIAPYETERDLCTYCDSEAWMHVNNKNGPLHLCRRCYALHSRQRDMRSPQFSYEREWIFPPRWKTMLQANERDD